MDSEKAAVGRKRLRACVVSLRMPQRWSQWSESSWPRNDFKSIQYGCHPRIRHMSFEQYCCTKQTVLRGLKVRDENVPCKVIT
eukprot:4511447-Amphidinium_carterae.1